MTKPPLQYDQYREIFRLPNDQRLSAIIDCLPEGLIVISSTGIVEIINPAAQALLSIRVPNPNGRHFSEVIWIASIQRFIAEVQADGFTREDEAVHDSGYGERYLHLYGTLIDEEIEDGAYLIVLRDITNVKKLEKMRRDFVANVSHELKTPITVIQGFVETLLSGPHRPEDTERFLSSIARQTERLNHLFDDLLLLSRLEQEYEREKISRTQQTLLPILSSIIDSFEMRAKEKGIDLSVNCTPECSATINTNLFEQTVVNLIQNAIEHTSQGGCVVVTATSDDSLSSISIKDTGCGIEFTQIDRIFERFYRVDKSRARKHGGTGLGLSIVKHIAQLHGGRVSVKSTLGEGSEFILEVPVV